jgi:DNA-binding transcriptional ArsR family regulator
MTTREFYTSIINYLDGQDIDGTAVQEFAKDALAKLDARNEKAKARPRKADPAVTARKDAVTEFVATNEGEFTADEIAEILGLTAPQVSSALRVHVAGGKVTKGSRKIDSKHSKVTYVIGA